MKKAIITFFIIMLSLIILCISLLTVSVNKNTYTQDEIYNYLKDKDVSLLQSKSIIASSKYNFTNFIEFIDGSVKDNSIELYDADLFDNNLHYFNYNNLDNYCQIIILENNQIAVNVENDLKAMKDYIFKEKNIIFITNNPKLKEKYLKILRKMKGRNYD